MPEGRRPLDRDWASPPAGVTAVRPKPVRPVLHRAAPRWVSRYVVLLVAIDLLAASLGAGFAFLTRFGDVQGHPHYVWATIGFPLAFVICAAATRTYESRFVGSGSEEFRRLFDATVRFGAVVAILSYAFRLEIARGYLVLAFPLALVLAQMGHYCARRMLHRQRAAGNCVHRVLVIGRERSIAELVRQVRSDPTSGFTVVGACIDHPHGPEVEGVPVAGDSASIVEALARTGADTVAVTAWSDLSQADLRRLSWQLEGSGVDVLVAPRLTDVAGPRIHVRPVAGLPLLHIEEPEFRGGRRLLKALMDRVVAVSALVLLSPVLLVVAAAIRLTSPGPALFRQCRAGARGETFTLYKFRTMRQNAEAELAELQERNENADGLLFKIRDDPRITAVGRWLRRYSIDELPQLINIAKGDMSLVGPRPPLPSEVARYQTDVRRRLLVKPGLTGLWQVSGRSDLTWEQSVRLDLHYVENWSFAFDMAILWKTVFAVLSRRGAY